MLLSFALLTGNLCYLQLVNDHGEVIGVITYSAAAQHTEQSHKATLDTWSEAYSAGLNMQPKSAPSRQHSGLDRRPSATRQVPASAVGTTEECVALDSTASEATHDTDAAHARMVHAPSYARERQLCQQERLTESAGVHGLTSQDSEAFIYSSTGGKDCTAPH